MLFINIYAFMRFLCNAFAWQALKAIWLVFFPPPHPSRSMLRVKRRKNGIPDEGITRCSHPRLMPQQQDTLNIATPN